MSRERNPLEATTRAVREMNAASAQTSAQHLAQLRSVTATETADPSPELVVVSIPDVSLHRPAECRTESIRGCSTPSGSETTKIKADLSSDNDSQKKHAEQRGPFANQAASAPAQDHSATTSTSSPTPIPASTPKSSSAKAASICDAWWYSLENLSQDRPVEEIARKILRQFPSIAPSSLLFTSADVELSTNRSTARIAACIARLTGCRVLLVDANWEANAIAIQEGEKAVQGLSEVIVEGTNWKDLLVETQESQLFVLPCGVADVPMRRVGNDTLIALNSQWQRDFTYVFINGGNARQWVARRFAVTCDGTYVLVGLNQTTRSDAQSAIRVLTEAHARVLGAIVFDAPPKG
jgi:Mrp family chromosome partitioning ATPase